MPPVEVKLNRPRTTITENRMKAVRITRNTMTQLLVWDSLLSPHSEGAVVRVLQIYSKT